MTDVAESVSTETRVPVLEAEGLIKTYKDPERGEVLAVKGLDLACYPGEVFGLLGPNGAGKTTTLRMLASILAPTGGTARVAGVDVSLNPLEVRRRIGFLSGSTGLYGRLTARETLEYFGRLHGMAGDELDAAVKTTLDAFDLHAFADGRCEGLSTGQKQRVSIARAVLHDPPVLILDEPTTGLDVLAASDMIRFIEGRREAGTCVILSTHVLSEAERLCDRIGIVNNGRMLAIGTLEDLKEQTGQRWLEDVFKVLVGIKPATTEDAPS
mgnify:CR=1 FL=1|tara:strand:+ start:9745 stop:10551 length:807 start_codon:yes stop_codon:yes gene_type:complete